MNSRGIIRKIDELGRIVIPKEMRKKLDIDTGSALEIHIEGDAIVMKKDTPVCIFCGSEATAFDYLDKSICHACLSEIQKDREL